MAICSLIILILRFHYLVDNIEAIDDSEVYETEFVKKTERFLASKFPKDSKLVLSIIFGKPFFIHFYMICKNIDRKQSYFTHQLFMLRVFYDVVAILLLATL
jgi:predicted enzyme involved in methoxymalonyl-ACP biosynthesis